MTSNIEPASFRDPSGFLFRIGNDLYRQVNQTYRHHYDRLMASGLYAMLSRSGYLISHQELELNPIDESTCYKIIQPEKVTFISYPYEWCFSQLKDAALLTIQIQELALEYGMTLKDASAYNIQFHRGKPVLIDSLSFETYEEGKPWVAYRQFCQHFLAPLSLMALMDIRLQQLLRVFIDGIPLDLSSSLLPGKTHLNLGLELHIHRHAASQKKYANKSTELKSTGKVSKLAFMGLVDSLKSTVQGLKWQPAGTEWGDYYTSTNYSDKAFQNKLEITGNWIEIVNPVSVWDLGANTGEFSRLASERSHFTLAADIDPAAVEKAYCDAQTRKDTNLLPLLLDLTNPSPAIGWENQERRSILQRTPAGLVLALALVHHLAISNNVPLDKLASFFSSLSPWLIIEFIPKDDSQVQRLLASREDIFPDYNPAAFEETFKRWFKIRESQRVEGSTRILYLMESRK